ncbi:MAG: histidinol-phosphate transaminase [Steroidobacteraceae bacterium]
MRRIEETLPPPAAANPERVALEHVAAIPPYPPGRPISSVAREYGLDPKSIIKLASNENPLGPSPRARQAIVEAAGAAALYPDFDTFALRESLSRHLGVAPERILPGAGSSDFIVLVARAFLGQGRCGLISQHSFPAYRGAIAATGARAIVVPSRDYALDLERTLEAIDDGVRLLYLATPNNPTGTRISPAALAEFIACLPEHVILALDEAYRDYLEPSERPATDHLPEARPNVVVLRTFSKIHGLAGLRVGYAIGDPRLLGLLRRLQTPFSVSALAEAAAVAALADPGFAEKSRLLNLQERTRMQQALGAAGIDFIPSHANFVLLRTGSSRATYEALLRRGIIVRPMEGYGLPECVRASIGLPEEDDAFLHHMLELRRGAAPA